MADVTEAALADRTKQIVFWGSVVLSSDYVRAAAVKTAHAAHHWFSERPCFRCVWQRRVHLAQQSLSSTPLAIYTALSVTERASTSALRHTTITPASVVDLQSSLRRKRSGAIIARVCQLQSFNLSVVRVLRWICTTLLLACDITIAASVREPAASAVTLAVAVAASASKCASI